LPGGLMAKFRKKPVEIEAVRVYVQEDHPQAITLAWKDQKTGAILGPTVFGAHDCRVVMAIRTLEGWHEVTPGDWVITGVKGEFYPCKRDIFDLTYEAVE